MDNLNNLREKLIDELVAMGKKDGEMTPSCLDVIFKATQSVLAIDGIKGMDEANRYNSQYSSNGYSGDYSGSSYPTRSMNRMGRDSRGRFDGSNGYSGNYSYHNEPHNQDRTALLMDELEYMMRTASSDRERDAINLVMSKMHD